MRSLTTKLNRSPVVFAILLGLLFLCMLILNHWTPYLVDDYAYMNSWETGQPLQGLGDIPASMYRHCFTMNGRVISHSFEQIFLLMPKVVFDLCNSAVFVWVIYTCFALCCGSRKTNAVVLLAVGMSVWVFLPVFGQVCLWQVGSLNYLWALAAALLYLRPFLSEYAGQEEAPQRRTPLWKRIAFTLLAIPVGMYSEITSLVSIFIACALTVLLCVERKSAKSWLWFPVAAAVFGFLLLLKMPAETSNKVGDYSLREMFDNIPAVAELFRARFLVPSILWVVLMCLAVMQKTNVKRRLVSLLFALGAAGGSFVLIAAPYIPERSLCTTALFLILADGVLFYDLLSTRADVVCRCAVCVLSVVFVLSFVIGVMDVRYTCSQFREREASILSQKAEGSSDVLCRRITSSTEYSAAYGLKELDMNDPYTWPNKYIAQFYGVSSVTALKD